MLWFLQEVRIVNKTKEDKAFSFAFAEFETAECSAAALSCLHGYQFDPDKAELGAMHLRYARGGSHKGRAMQPGPQDGKPVRQATQPTSAPRKAPVMQQQSQGAPQRAGGFGQQQRSGVSGGNRANQGPRGSHQGGRPHGGMQPMRGPAAWRGGR
jgi:hypothetical protein